MRLIAARDNRQPAGFTVLEIILVLLILSIVATMGSFGIISYGKSYQISRDASQKLAEGQLAMLRLAKEFVAINSVSSASATAITFTTQHNQHEDGSHTYTISKSGSNLVLSEGGTDYTLASNVSAFTLAYYEWDYDTGNTGTLVLTSPAAWVDEVTCCNPISISVSKATCSDGTLEIEFTANNSSDEDYKITYGGSDYDTKDSYKLKDTVNCNNSTTNSTKAYVWNTTAGRECYIEIKIPDTTLTNNPPPFTLIGGTRLIKATLTINGTDPFTISAAPRNVNSCPPTP